MFILHTRQEWVSTIYNPRSLFSETPKATLSWVIAMSSNAMIIHNDSVGDYLGADKFQQWSFGMHTALCALEFIIH